MTKCRVALGSQEEKSYLGYSLLKGEGTPPLQAVATCHAGCPFAAHCGMSPPIAIFIKINRVLLRRILINYPVMKDVRRTTLPHQAPMITLIDALASFSWQGRNEKHNTPTFKGDLGGKHKLPSDREMEWKNRGSEALGVNRQTNGLSQSTDHWVYCQMQAQRETERAPSAEW